MSFYDLIPIAAMVISLVGIILIVIRKFPALSAINIESIKSEQEAEIKEKIIVTRLQRKVGDAGRAFKKIFLLPFSAAGAWFKKFYNKILTIEKRYVKKKPAVPPAPEELEQKIKALFLAADEFFKEGILDEAEKKYIEIVALDHKNVDVYKKLGSLYLEQKNYDNANETFQYTLKLNPNDIETLIDLAMLQKQKGENEKALVNFQRAAELEPTNPKNLDFLIEISIILGKNDLAKETLEKLKEVNPENQKLAEFEERINSLK
jgi:tetratricopeptide (TPR) repeat protein